MDWTVLSLKTSQLEHMCARMYTSVSSYFKVRMDENSFPYNVTFECLCFSAYIFPLTDHSNLPSRTYFFKLFLPTRLSDTHSPS